MTENVPQDQPDEVPVGSGSVASTVASSVTAGEVASQITPSDMSSGFVCLHDVTVNFPMHLDERARSFRSGLLPMLRGRSPRYKHALNRINLEARNGERIGMVGRNGSGKTTLLRTLSGVYEPDTGSIMRVGRTVSMINLSMGMDLYASGYENIRRRAMLYGIRGDEIDRTVTNVEAFTELGDALNDAIRTYSSGMLARLSFGIATSVEADIILMDEWISAGDARFINRAKDRMENFISEDRIMFLASHSAGLIRTWCNRILVLDGGVICHDGHDIDAGLEFYRNLLGIES